MKRYTRIQASSNNRMFNKIRDAIDTQVLAYYMRGGMPEAECRKYFKVVVETTPKHYTDGTDMHLLTVYLDALEPDSYESDYLANDFMNEELKYWAEYAESHPEEFEDVEDDEIEPIIYGNVEELQYKYLDPLIKKFNRQYYFEKESSYVLICNLDT